MSMAWHKNCLKNVQESLKREEEELERFAARVERTRSQVRFYEQQIEEATKKRRDGFDSEKFGRKVGHVD
jgi:hypothetical protein